ncbi:MAG: hypothetical protein LUH47_09300 [Clostridiales bacterium]|nr:hypothetical protein [Clostridiales bacterium]
MSTPILTSIGIILSDRTLNFYNADPKNKKRDINWVRENTVIIHYFGKQKPWNEKYRGILDIFYKELKEEYAEKHSSSVQQLTTEPIAEHS